MKVLLSVVPQEQVVKELLDAMNQSIDIFTKDESFDFLLARIDRFLIPPKYVERHDHACSSYWDKNTLHPSSEAMEPILARLPEEFTDRDCLEYAAILCRAGGFERSACWGAYFYVRFTHGLGKPQMFIRLDCRESNILRDEAPTTNDIYGQMWLPGADRFSLPWVFAWAAKEISFEGEWEYHPKRKPHPVDPVDKVAHGFHCFRSGLGEIIALCRKAKHNSDTKRLLLYGWACAAMPEVRPSPFLGAGQHLQKLFAELET